MRTTLQNRFKQEFESGHRAHTVFDVVLRTGCVERYHIQITFVKIIIITTPRNNLEQFQKMLMLKYVRELALDWEVAGKRFYKDIDSIPEGISNMFNDDTNNLIFVEIFAFIKKISDGAAGNVEFYSKITKRSLQEYLDLTQRLQEFAESEQEFENSEELNNPLQDSEEISTESAEVLEETLETSEELSEPIEISQDSEEISTESEEFLEDSEIPIQKLLPLVKWDALGPVEKVFKKKYYYKLFNYINFIGYTDVDKTPVITIKSFCSYDSVYIKIIRHDGENQYPHKKYAALIQIINANITKRLPTGLWDWILLDGVYFYTAKISRFKGFALYNLLKNMKQNLIYQGILNFVLQACAFTNVTYEREPYACTWVTKDSLQSYYKLKQETRNEIQENKRPKYKHTYEDDTEYPT